MSTAYAKGYGFGLAFDAVPVNMSDADLKAEYDKLKSRQSRLSPLQWQNLGDPHRLAQVILEMRKRGNSPAMDVTPAEVVNLAKQAEATSRRWERRAPEVAEAWARVAVFYRQGDLARAKQEIAKADKLADKHI